VLFWTEKQHVEKVVTKVIDPVSEVVSTDPIEPIEVKPQEPTVIQYEQIQLHLAIGIMPEQLVDTNAIFFLKNHKGPIPHPTSSISN
jgi:hypothetical protein